jgi:hypothetical protein
MRALAFLGCLAGASLAAPPAALAIVDDPNNDGPSEGSCPLSSYDFALEGNLVLVGVPLVGTQVQINATSAKLVGRKNTSTRICDALLFEVPRFRWSIVSVPRGQSATLANGGSLTTALNLGGVGAYRVRLTACPSKCTLKLSGKSKTVGPFTKDVTITAVTQFTPRPETEPFLPKLFAPGEGKTPEERNPGEGTDTQNGAWPTMPAPRFTDSQRSDKCPFGGGVTAAQWMTAEPFAGAGNYRTVEGTVETSGLPAEDNFLNHDSQDHVWEMQPDRPYFGLMHPNAQGEMEMEWETNIFPREFRPTAGDRATVTGYWILDCGHGFRAEIHPPVGVGVHRSRAVYIPPSFAPPGFPGGLGTNVRVPGIVTDIFFSRKSGEMTGNCSTTGLWSPPIPGAAFPANVFSSCVKEPHPLNDSFTFNVYLPPDPYLSAQKVGLSPPRVPLFTKVETIRSRPGGPEPTLAERRSSNGAVWVEVTVDLSSLPASQNTYARRIYAAWAYPHPENWGARRWRVRLNSIKVLDDAEPFGQDGDWHFFFNTDNRDREWTNVFNCDDGCIDEGDTRRLNRETGTAAEVYQGLGPDLVLFPGQGILVHTTGFDEEVWGDSIGTVFQRLPQSTRPGNYAAFSNGGDGAYRLNYAIGGGGLFGRAALTPEAANLLEAYTVRARPPCQVTQAQAAAVGRVQPACVISPEQRSAALANATDTNSFVLTRRVQKEESLPPFESEFEENTLNGISPRRLRTLFDSLRKSDPKRLNAFLDEIKEELRAVPVKLRRDYFELVAALDFALPKSLRNRPYPPGFRKQVRAFPVRLR